LQDLAQRHFQVLLNVVAQRLERRNVEDFGAVLQVAGNRLAHQAVNAGEECGERLARAGGGGDQRGAASKNVRPALFLRLGRRAEPSYEPLGDDRMGPPQGPAGGRHSVILCEVYVFAKHSPCLRTVAFPSRCYALGSMRAYKFLDERFGLKSLSERRLKISTLADLNDPFELLPYEMTDRNRRVTLMKTRDELSRNRGVLCFSASWRDPVVWAHYSDKHRGLCLGFEIPDEHCKKVKYVENRLQFPRVPTLADAEVLLFTKYINWQYEEEIRVWAALNDSEEGLYFSNFGEALRLVKVIAGARSSLPESKIVLALGPLAKEITLVKARAGFTGFEIVKDKRGFRE